MTPDSRNGRPRQGDDRIEIIDTTRPEQRTTTLRRIRVSTDLVAADFWAIAALDALGALR